jgi:hypothetical protein
VARHRGKSPRQAAFFTRSLRMRREAAVFASVSSLFGLITPQTIAVGDRLPTPLSTHRRWRAALLCEAFEAIALDGRLADLLRARGLPAGALLSRRRVAVAHCRDCTGVLVTDRLALRIPSATNARTRGACNGPVAARRLSGATLTRWGRFARVTIRPTLFAGPFLERRAELRDDPAWIAAARPTRHALLLATGARSS